MTTATQNPLIVVLQELSLARSMVAFAESLEFISEEVSGCEEALYFRYDAVAQVLVRHSEGRESQVEVSEGTLPGFCALNCEAVNTKEENLPVPGAQSEVQSAQCVPMRRYGSTVGVLALINPGPTMSVAQLEEIAEVAAVTQEFVARTEDLTAFTARTEELLVQAVERREASEAGHVMRVAHLASELGELLDMSSTSRQLIWRAAQYHDVGKLIMAGRPAAELERLHSTAGADYLRGSRVLRELAPLVEAHHERYDGTGFPHGKKGDAVPIEGWVLALAEDLVEFQQQRGSLGEKSVEAFLSERASVHHPAVIDALGGLLVSGRLQDLLAR